MAHYLITGHTGFKGAWLIFLLKAQGHDVSGLALDPLPGSIFDRANLENDLVHDFRLDIRNREETVDAIRHAQPDYVIHMAAQALVREGYRNPRYTYETNVLGTMNVLEAVDQSDSVQAQLIVTTDKVYLDQGLNRPYVETDPLGGKDPYSASKAMADILTQEYLSRDGSKPGAIARAGNVIGAGDVSNDRLIPDIVRAIETGEPLVLRYPEAIRPWQHVLDCLWGYLTLLGEVQASDLRGAWNFGPGKQASLSVRQVAQISAEKLGVDLKIQHDAGGEFLEDEYLVLDSNKAQSALGWDNRIEGVEAISMSLVPSGGFSQGKIISDVKEFLSRPSR
jgi:CDP-glucose 4,6-dehydratase